MMNKKTVQIIIIALLLTVLSVPLCVIFDSARIFEIGQKTPRDIGSFNEIGVYKIDPDTILTSIDYDQTDMFLPDTTSPYVSTTNNSIDWKQSEYLKIANALHEFVWKERLDGWSVYKIRFDTSCQKNTIGFDSAEYIFYKPIFQHGELKYDARAIDISLLNGNVSWGGDTTFPRPILGANVIDLDKLKITADEALSIAEENGGKAARLSVQNNCDLYLVFHGNWRVVYAGTKGLPILEVNINPYTGKIITSP